MHIDFLLGSFENHRKQTAIWWQDAAYPYEWLASRIAHWSGELRDRSIETGEVVALVGDFTSECIAIMLALVENANIIVPLNNKSTTDHGEKLTIAQVEKIIHVDDRDVVRHEALDRTASHDFYAELRSKHVPGLVLFTSGTSGVPKGAMHNFAKLLEKFKTPRLALRTINFLMFDHWGGLNTMLHVLSNGGVVYSVQDRSPENISRLIERHQIDLLPASPTFLNLLLLSESHKTHDLSSLKIISYGTEPMPESTLKRLRQVFPGVKLSQTYGLIEIGVLRSKSENDDSLWVKVGGDGFQTRVVDGILHIKAESAMLGYLNAESPFSDDGWFITGDEVVQNGEYIKILGRKSEIINVGGEKVYPAEVESAIHEMDNVRDVTVYKESNPIVGNIVCARVSQIEREDHQLFARRIKVFCKGRLQPYMIPVKVTVDDQPQHGDRFKKQRTGN